ncbi:MAG: ATP-dependent helicase RecG [Acidobacteriaceae bacterium]|nr:ATP-dependent helicase RecG [Acidobacteriaceae bacterium]MEA3008227.1 ATP-dependent helicase RecG [Acidobacteriaceae bacterium]
MLLTLETSLQFVKGIGPRIAQTLQEKRIATIEDLLYHLPFRYEDRLRPQAIEELVPGEMASLIGEVRGMALLRTRRMPIFEMTVGQGLGGRVKCMWFHGTYLKDRFKAGQWVALYGKVEPSRSTNSFKMIQPQVEVLPDDHDDEESKLLEVGRIAPVYETLGNKLASRWQRRIIYRLLEELKGRIPETLPQAICRHLDLPSREAALRWAHFPEAGTPMSQLQGWVTPAQKRLIFEELFFLELGLELKRKKFRQRQGIPFETNAEVRAALRQVLPFHPTKAQKTALGEIVADMRAPEPMRRLLQGDVGSGKTIVALQAMLVAIENGYQAALMAPTEILATQHFLGARKLLERSQQRYKVVLLTGSLEEDRKRENRGLIARGEAQLVIGTHALIEERVDFARLGLVVVDEQHRFGVLQRFRLMKKPNAGEPDVLVMTATPIPRTLALSLYGDLDLSVLDELPPGRTPIVTRQVADDKAGEVWKLVREQVQKGRQAYVVYPVIEGAKEDQPELDFAAGEPEPEDPSGRPGLLFKKVSTPSGPSLKAATDMYQELKAGALQGLRLGLLHGRMDADEKEIIMRRFQRGEVDVLIATTVIEVGVDVPNATMMVIEHAERFGLAQMHQLRGRVGRGNAKSYCVLMTGGKISAPAAERLAAMVRTQNGFELAELDLQLRGPGEFFGTRQAGIPDFRVANLVRDRALLELAKTESAWFVSEAGSEVTEEEKGKVWARLREAWQRRYGLVDAG